MFKRIKSFLLYNADQKNKNSYSEKFRKKRLEFLKEFCEGIKKPVRILDLGGSDYHWKNSVFENNRNYHITLVNVENQNVKDFTNFCFIKKNAVDLKQFYDNEYDLVYSNSLLEHLNSLEKQEKIAGEIARIGIHYFIQTPNYYFPVEPHFLFPLFQFFPDELKVRLISNFDLGWYDKQEDDSKARELATSVRLMKKKELKKIFPGAGIFSERCFFFNKSFIVYK